MREFLLSDENGALINKIEGALCGIISTVKGKSEKKELSGRHYLLISAPKSYSDYFKERLVGEVGKRLLYREKRSSYARNLPILGDKVKDFLLLRALVFSDFRAVLDILKGDLNELDNFYLDGVCNFFLKREMEEWKEIADTVKENRYRLDSAEEFKKYLSCITSTIDGDAQTIYLTDKPNLRVIKDDLTPLSYSYKEEENLSDVESVLACVIENFPKRLILSEQALPRFIVEGLKYLF